MPINHFPRHGDYRCRICDSRSGPFYDDDFGKIYKSMLAAIKEEDFAKLLEQEENYIRDICKQILKFKPDLVITEKGVSGLY